MSKMITPIVGALIVYKVYATVRHACIEYYGRRIHCISGQLEICKQSSQSAREILDNMPGDDPTASSVENAYQELLPHFTVYDGGSNLSQEEASQVLTALEKKQQFYQSLPTLFALLNLLKK